jgi:hypothetical protein
MSIAGLSMPTMYILSESGEGVEGEGDGFSIPPMPLVPNRSDVPQTPVYIPPATTYRPASSPTAPQVMKPVYDPSAFVQVPAEEPDEGPRIVLVQPEAPPAEAEGEATALAKLEIVIEPGRVTPPDHENSKDPQEPEIRQDQRETEVGSIDFEEQLQVLAELEGEQDFRKTTDPSRWSYGNQGRGQGSGGGQSNGQTDGIPDEDEGSGTREVEEADIVHLRGNILYILNPYKGLIVMNVRDPEWPVLLCTYPVYGNPVDMYIVDKVAYIIVVSDIGYWYGLYRQTGSQNLGGQGQGQNQGMGQGELDSTRGDDGAQYPIGSRLVIIDLAKPREPKPLVEISIEGFARDSRKVGDVIYFVSSCYSWYNRYLQMSMLDLTYVFSLNVRDIRNILLADSTFFDGHSFVIHASSRYLYVSESIWSWDDKDYHSNITLVDISDPAGHIAVLDRITVKGTVFDKYQMDEYGDTFRVVSHLRDPWKSKLWTFDISNPGEVTPLGQLLIDDMGDLRATRFAGDRVYTIHLPQRPDPLDVIDVSDPANPVLCDVLQMPGWVEHLEVRGYNILAVGIVQDGWKRYTHLSLFDVSDPYNAVMVNRIMVGNGFTSSTANSDPKALTVLDDQGLVLLPFDSYYREDGYYYYKHVFGVQLVSFDLETGDLWNRGTFEQPDNVLRTRAIGNHIISTSKDHLVIADISNLDDPEVTSTFGLSPNIVDIHMHKDRTAELILSGDDNSLILRVFRKGALDLLPPIWEAKMGYASGGYRWDGRYIHVPCVQMTEDRHVVFEVNTWDIMGISSEPKSTSSIDTGLSSNSNYRTWMFNPGYDYWDHGSFSYRWPNIYTDIGNPVYLDGGVWAFYTEDNLWFLEVGKTSWELDRFHIELDCRDYFGLLPAGKDLYVITRDRTYVQMVGYKTYVSNYRATLVRMDGSSGPRVCSPIDIPGLPISASEDGLKLYTACNWYSKDLYGRETLNVVSFNDGVATIDWAIEITNHSVRLDGDRAVVSRVVESSMESGDGTLMWWNDTYVFSVDLFGKKLDWTYTIVGDANLLTVDEGVALLYRPGEGGTVVVDLMDRTTGSVSFSKIRPFGHGIHREGSLVYVAQARYGVNMILLNMIALPWEMP